MRPAKEHLLARQGIRNACAMGYVDLWYTTWYHLQLQGGIQHKDYIANFHVVIVLDLEHQHVCFLLNSCFC